jgi:hypothetical protein
MARWPAGVPVDRARRLTDREKWGRVPRPRLRELRGHGL